ncbi:MAG TPA: sigma-70 family RNA polymerase sigma factor [Miltoncostaeaceae bacterium]|jgi:RNA polymerase sigma-70 factor (ECF subfamily)|nr:sigma-70 family RNA polymerase sigma factor [Miltoncostaeaceae bacterium]
MSGQVQATPDDGTAAFQAARPRMLAVARRVLGSRADAEDVVQEAWLRWQGTDRRRVRDAPTFLATTALRLAINVTQSARVRRETPVGRWRAEPDDPGAGPAAGVEGRDALVRALGVLETTLSPAERAAYILREAFDYPHRRIAGALDLSEVNARQLVRRARERLRDGGDGHGGRADPAAHRRLVEAVQAASGRGDLAALERLLAADLHRAPLRAAVAA